MSKMFARIKAIDQFSRAASNLTEKTTIKQLNWDNLPYADFRKRCVGGMITCLKNAIGNLHTICDPNPYNQIFLEKIENALELD